jgi:hypothetical protein
MVTARVPATTEIREDQAPENPGQEGVERRSFGGSVWLFSARLEAGSYLQAQGTAR